MFKNILTRVDPTIRICPFHQKDQTVLVLKYSTVYLERWCPACGFTCGLNGGYLVKSTIELMKKKPPADYRTIKAYLKRLHLYELDGRKFILTPKEKEQIKTYLDSYTFKYDLKTEIEKEVLKPRK